MALSGQGNYPLGDFYNIDVIPPEYFLYLGDTLYVGGSGPNNYSKIQDAINDSDNGDTIFVYNGIYYENVIVNKSVFLNGQNIYSTIIDGGKRHDFDTVYISADDVTLSGFTIQNSGEDPSSPDCGVFIHSSDGITIIGNRIINNNGGLKLHYSNHNIVSNNYISQNKFGISIRGRTLNTIISDNIINENEGNGIHCGSDYEVCNNEISGNQICYNEESGIYIPCGNHYLIYGNNIHGNRFNGIWIINDCSNHSIIGNDIYYNEVGIESNGDNNSFIGNMIKHNYIGIRFNGADNNNLSNNDISHNIEIGFLLGYSNGNYICQNNFVDNSLNCFIVGQKTDDNYLNGNYWERFRVFPKIILGVEKRLEWIFDNVFIPKFYFDMNPASGPYDI